jgi:hypothetical protein
MKSFDSLEFDPQQCQAELAEFRTLLKENEWLGERKHILPFFRERRHLSAFIGTYHHKIGAFDRIAFELSISGDFTCDLAVGHANKQAYCFIEFEAALERSIFARRNRHVSEWGRDFERGYSQIIDWFWKLEEQAGTSTFNQIFGSPSPDFMGILVIGRSVMLDELERGRLRWRGERVVVNSKHIRCVTYDELLADLEERISIMRRMVREEIEEYRV